MPLAQVSDQCMALVNTVLTWFHKLLGNSTVAERQVVFQKGLNSSVKGSLNRWCVPNFTTA